MIVNLKELALNEPEDKKLTFDEAVGRTKDNLPMSDVTIISLTLHPNGLWTVRYMIH